MIRHTLRAIISYEFSYLFDVLAKNWTYPGVPNILSKMKLPASKGHKSSRGKQFFFRTVKQNRHGLQNNKHLTARRTGPFNFLGAACVGAANFSRAAEQPCGNQMSTYHRTHRVHITVDNLSALQIHGEIASSLGKMTETCSCYQEVIRKAAV